MNWLLRHVQALLATLGQLVRAPVATALTVTVMGLAMALPLALGLVAQNLREVGSGLGQSLELSAWFRLGTPEERAALVARKVGERHGVASVHLVTAAQGLAEFRRQSGFGAALDALEENPLPHVLVVRPAGTATSPAEIESLRRFLAAWPEVESVQADGAWVQRYNAGLDLARRLLLALALLLGAGVVAVVGNTVRLEIQKRRAEIEVTLLVGGTHAFVRRPFLYAGALYGLLAALLALGVVAGGILWLRPAVQQLAAAYGSDFRLQAIEPGLLERVLGAGALLGWLGAWLAATRELDRSEPEA